MIAEDGPVEHYLDELFARLHGAPRDVRRALAEVEGHLIEAVATAEAEGIDPAGAERQAVARFGPVDEVAARFNGELAARSTPALVRGVLAQLLPLAGVGLVAIGLSGLVAGAMTAVWGRTFVFADPPGTRYPSGACHYWQQLHPHAADCTQAFLAEAYADGLQARFAAGLLGVLLLAGLGHLRRRRGRPVLAAPGLLPGVTGAVAFLLAAAALGALGLDRLRLAGGNGAGQWLSAAAVALPVGVAYALAFARASARVSPGAYHRYG